jgi:hypothetical protein
VGLHKENLIKEMAPKPKQPAGPAMTLGLNDACRHVALIDVSSYPADTEMPWFRTRVVCAKCGGRGHKIDVRPNWKEQPTQPSLTGKKWR